MIDHLTALNGIIAWFHYKLMVLTVAGPYCTTGKWSVDNANVFADYLYEYKL